MDVLEDVYKAYVKASMIELDRELMEYNDQYDKEEADKNDCENSANDREHNKGV